jgi:hypothetical protein
MKLCTSVLFNRIFTASDIAHKLSSALTKTEAIINLITSPQAIENITQLLKNNRMSYCEAATDTRNHNAVKVFCVLIQYIEQKKMVTYNQNYLKCSNSEMKQQRLSLSTSTEL